MMVCSCLSLLDTTETATVFVVSAKKSPRIFGA
jgi:hypothetical protein